MNHPRFDWRVALDGLTLSDLPELVGSDAGIPAVRKTHGSARKALGMTLRPLLEGRAMRLPSVVVRMCRSELMKRCARAARGMDVVGLNVRSRALPVLSCAAVLVLSGCRSESWTQRLSIIVETPAGLVSADSVTRVSFAPRIEMFGPMDSDRWTLKGEALALEVTKGRWLFVLLPQQDMLLLHTLSERTSTKQDVARIRTEEAPVALPPRRYPLMVTFNNLADPNTLVQVDPQDMTPAFGEGVRIRSLTVQRSHDAATSGKMRGLLPWVCELFGENVELGNGSDEFRHNGGRVFIRPHHFATGAC